MLKQVAAAIGAAMLVLAPGVASAQDDDGMMCVYDAAVAGDYETIAEAFLYGTDEELTKTSEALLDTATQTCSDQFKFSAGGASAARELAIYGVAVDYLTEDLAFMGVSDAAIDGVFNVYNGLSGDDLDRLYDAGWRSNAEFMARLKAGFIAAGVPDAPEEMGTAFDIVEISAMADDAMMEFMFAEDA